jgi:diaminopimelate epimerase
MYKKGKFMPKIESENRNLQLQDGKTVLESPVHADACGNTFIIYDCLHYSHTSKEWEELKEILWDHFPETGVDNVLVLRKIEENEETIRIKMHVLDPYRTEADFCGNGARAVGAFLYRKYPSMGKKISLVSRLGEHHFLYIDEECFIEMGRPRVDENALEFKFGQEKYYFTFVDSIEPHLVTSDFFDPDLLTTLGYEINLKCRKRFPEGVNINCYRNAGPNALEVLTFERGLYRMTAACGTGSAACAQHALKKQKMISFQSNVTIYVLGGQLKILPIHGVFWLGGPVRL